jgi:hypothetical protein
MQASLRVVQPAVGYSGLTLTCVGLLLHLTPVGESLHCSRVISAKFLHLLISAEQTEIVAFHALQHCPKFSNMCQYHACTQDGTASLQPPQTWAAEDQVHKAAEPRM